MYAVFDLGAVFYWAIPTAPPWWAALHGDLEDDQTVHMRRMMIEYGEQFWGDRWGDLYDVLGGNPLAAMPSLHFATSLMAAHVLAETGPVAGALGFSYAALLGLALVYLGEHYVADLIAGAALAETVRTAGTTHGAAGAGDLQGGPVARGSRVGWDSTWPNESPPSSEWRCRRRRARSESTPGRRCRGSGSRAGVC